MRLYYLEIVTPEVDATCAAAEAIERGGTIAHLPLEIHGHGKFAIYIHGGIHHGLWQV
jgi:hypothetical protein